MKICRSLLVAVALVAVVLGAIIIYVALVMFSFPPMDSVASFNWTDVCHGAVVGIYLTTDSLWMTNRSRKITFLFAVNNISCCPNASTFYNNSHIILNSVKLDPSYINMSESPFEKLSERQAWTVDWRFTPKADDFILSSMGISKDKHIQYSMYLEVNYTVVDSEGVEWPGLFENWAAITIVGGEDSL